MDFANEEYRRLYVRDTITWKRLGWDGQNVLMQLLRKMDRAGVMDLGGLPPADAVALLVGTDVANVEVGLGRVLELEVVHHKGDALVWPTLVEAQTVNKTDKQRQRESRDRRRSVGLGSVTRRDATESHRVTAASQEVTNGHSQSHAVTRGHERSHAVTHSSAEHSEAEHSIASASTARDARDAPAEAVRGLTWYAGALLGGDTTQAPHLGSWRNEYAALGRKSVAERQAVQEALAVDVWVQANRRTLDPGHLVKHWARYAAGGRKAAPPTQPPAEVAAARREAATASKAVSIKQDYAARIKAARDEGDEYTAVRLAAERDQRLTSLHAQAS